MTPNATIDCDIKSLITQYGDKNKLSVCITHTPQMNAADIAVGQIPVRVPELGFRVINKNGTQQYPQSLFTV